MRKLAQSNEVDEKRNGKKAEVPCTGRKPYQSGDNNSGRDSLDNIVQRIEPRHMFRQIMQSNRHLGRNRIGKGQEKCCQRGAQNVKHKHRCPKPYHIPKPFPGKFLKHGNDCRDGIFRKQLHPSQNHNQKAHGIAETRYQWFP